MDGKIALFFQCFADFLFTEHFEHSADLFTIAAAMKDRVLRFENDEVIFPEKPVTQGVDTGIEHFIRFQGRCQCNETLPGFFILGCAFAESVSASRRRHFLHKQAADDPVIGGQPQSGVELFGLFHIVFDDLCDGVACQRNDPLVWALSRDFFMRIKSDDAAALSIGVDEVGKSGIVRNGRFFIEFCSGTDFLC